jgi:hypothetical protein
MVLLNGLASLDATVLIIFHNPTFTVSDKIFYPCYCQGYQSLVHSLATVTLIYTLSVSMIVHNISNAIVSEFFIFVVNLFVSLIFIFTILVNHLDTVLMPLNHFDTA